MQVHNIKIAVYGSRYKVDHADSIRAFILELGRYVKPMIERKFHDFLRRDLGLRLPCDTFVESEIVRADYILSIGGDGTFLRAAHSIGASEVPIWGINSGRLGFLTDVDCEEAIPLIPKLLNGEGELERRAVISARVEGRYVGYALNEIAIVKRETGSIITIDTFLDKDYLAAYDADGLIISTPSGSTAYSLSVNGPIVMPQCRNLILTPIAPHTLNMRPIVVPDETVIRMNIKSRSESFLLATDGYTTPLPCDLPVFVRRADFDICMLRLKRTPFAETIRRKLMWGASVRS